MTTALCVCLGLIAGSPGEVPSTAAPALAASQQSQPVPRNSYELRKAVNAALRNSAPARKPDPAEAAKELIGLYEELRADTQIEMNDRKRLAGLVRRRLQALAEELEKLPAAKQDQPAALEPRGDLLAQQGLPAAGGFGAGFNAPGNAGRGRGNPPDHAQELIDLIKRTIAPTTWEDVGGLGSIRYYRPLKVLVIRQTQEVHEQIGGALGGLRAQ